MAFHKKGEISVIITFLTVLLSIMGVGIGSFITQHPQKVATSAQLADYPYYSSLEIRNIGGSIIDFEQGIKANNNSTNIGYDIHTNDKAQLVWDTQNVPDDQRDKKVDISLELPQSYVISNTFCTNIVGTSCDNYTSSSDKKTIQNIRIEKNAKINYGWIVSKTTNQPTIEKGNLEVTVEVLNYPQKTNLFPDLYPATNKLPTP